jgi:hypothetical protein
LLEVGTRARRPRNLHDERLSLEAGQRVEKVESGELLDHRARDRKPLNVEDTGLREPGVHVVRLGLDL